MTLPQRTQSAFRQIEDLLTTVDEIILASRRHSPFNDYLTQLSADQQKVIEQGVSELRTAMICILRQCGVVANDPHINTAMAVQRVLGDAFMRFSDWQRDCCISDSTKTGHEDAKMIRQINDAFLHMDDCLSSPEMGNAKR